MEVHSLGELRLWGSVAAIGTFDGAYASRSAQAFLEELSDLNLREIWVGHESRFGKGQSGDMPLLGTRFHTRVVNSIHCQTGEVISSMRVRSLLADGKPDYAATLLGLAAMDRNLIRVSPVWLEDPDLVARVETSNQPDITQEYSYIW